MQRFAHKLYLLLPCALVLSFVAMTPCFADDACDTSLIAALKTNYHIADTHVLSQAVYDAACSSGSHGVGASYEGISFNYNDASKACQTHDLKYFEKYDRDLAYSYLPAEAWTTIRDICNRNPVGLNVTVSGNVLTVSANFHPTGNLTHATVQSFSYTTNSASCTTHNIHRGTVIQNGPVKDICKRISDQPVSFIMNTSQGAQFSTLPAIPPKEYSVLIGSPDDHMDCLLNGGLIGSRNFGDPPIQITLTGLVPGKNTLQCTIRDDHPCGDGQACWSYSFQVFYGQDQIAGGSDSGHGRPPINPPPVIIDYSKPHGLFGTLVDPQTAKTIQIVPQ